jgi:hypothetical protein
MKFMQLETTTASPFPISYNLYNKMADARTCEVEATLLPLNLVS